MSKLNPLQDWLGITDDGRPVDYYRLLGLERFESLPEAIEAGYARRLKQLGPFRAEPHREKAERVVTLLQQARDHLLRPADKARYDAKLRALDQPQPAARASAAVPNKPRPAIAAPAESIPWRWAVAGIAALLLVGSAVTFSVIRLVNALSTPIVAQASQEESPPAPPAVVSPPPPPAVKPVEEALPLESEVEVPPTEPAAPPSLSADTPAAEEPAVQPATAETDVPPSAPTEVATEPAAEMPATDPAAEQPEEKEEPLIFTGGALPPPPAMESLIQRAEYIEAVREMLNAGLSKSPNREKAREHYERALALCDSDPRLFYGYALIIHPLQYDEAKKLLLRTMNQCNHNYPQAWRLLIEQQLKRSLDKNFLQGLLGFARRLDDVSDPWPDEIAKTEFAYFLGQVIGFVQGPGGSKAIAEEATAVDAKIAAALKESFLKAYEAGKEDLRGRQELLELEISEKSRKTTQAVRGELGDKDQAKQKLKDDEQKLVRKKEEYDATWEKLKAEFQKDWTKLEEEFKLAVEHARKCAVSVAETELRIQGIRANHAQQVAYAASLARVGGSAAPSPPPPPNVDGLVSAKAEFTNQMNTALRFAEISATKARLRLVQITEAEKEYLRETGKLYSESSFIADARKSIDTQASRIKKSKPVAARVPVKSAAELKRFGSYAPLDLQAEKKRILDSYANAEPVPQELP